MTRQKKFPYQKHKRAAAVHLPRSRCTYFRQFFVFQLGRHSEFIPNLSNYTIVIFGDTQSIARNVIKETSAKFPDQRLQGCSGDARSLRVNRSQAQQYNTFCGMRIKLLNACFGRHIWFPRFVYTLFNCVLCATLGSTSVPVTTSKLGATHLVRSKEFRVFEGVVQCPQPLQVLPLHKKCRAWSHVLTQMSAKAGDSSIIIIVIGLSLVSQQHTYLLYTSMSSPTNQDT